MIECIITGITVFTVTVLIGAMICGDLISSTKLKYGDRIEKLYTSKHKWKMRCLFLCEQLDEIKDAIVDKPEIKTKWSHYTEGE